MLEPIAYEFAPKLDGYEDLHSEKLGRLIAKHDRNAAARAETAKAARVTVFMTGVAVSLISLAVLAGAAKVAEQGRDNFRNWMAQNEPV